MCPVRILYKCRLQDAVFKCTFLGERPPPPPDEAQNHRLFKSSNLTAHRLYFIHHSTRNFIFPPFLRSLIALLVVAEKNVGDDDVLFFPRGGVVSEFLLYLVLLIVNLNFCKTLCYL